MSIRAHVILQVLLIALCAAPVRAADSDDAAAAAKAILSSLSNSQYELLWKEQASNYFKQQVSEDDFIASMAIGRAQLGKLGESKMLKVVHSDPDSATGNRGNIYSVTFLNTYTLGKFYERIVLIQEGDGKFRLSGLWGTPEASAPDEASQEGRR